MPREASLFGETKGSPLEAYLLLRQDGGNIPPAWIDRANSSRKNREKALANALKENSLDALPLLRDWEVTVMMRDQMNPAFWETHLPPVKDIMFERKGVRYVRAAPTVPDSRFE